MGSTLLNIFVDDALQAVRNKMNLYEDDLKLIGSPELSVTWASTQENLDLLSLWAHKWKLEFNIQKRKMGYFERKN